MPKGKPWTVEEERQLRNLREEDKTVAEIAVRLKKSPEAVKMKLSRLGLKVVTLKKQEATTSELIVPAELISIEEALKDLVAAMNALKQSELSKTEIMRLNALIQTSSLYQKRIAEYVDYRSIKREMMAWAEKYKALTEQAWVKRELEKQKSAATERAEAKRITLRRSVHLFMYAAFLLII